MRTKHFVSFSLPSVCRARRLFLSSVSYFRLCPRTAAAVAAACEQVRCIFLSALLRGRNRERNNTKVFRKNPLTRYFSSPPSIVYVFCDFATTTELLVLRWWFYFVSVFFFFFSKSILWGSLTENAFKMFGCKVYIDRWLNTGGISWLHNMYQTNKERVSQIFDISWCQI